MAGLADLAAAETRLPPHSKLNNLVSELLEISSLSGTNQEFTFTCPRDGWIHVTSSWNGKGSAWLRLEGESQPDTISSRESDSRFREEAMRYLRGGEHRIALECKEGGRLERL